MDGVVEPGVVAGGWWWLESCVVGVVDPGFTVAGGWWWFGSCVVGVEPGTIGPCAWSPCVAGVSVGSPE
ncbi:MAG: hypothetical protein KatS3mg010_1025 [Acidimicrobiia bacterium]|nr:MAG: hypothetical protein KatS3mg010_1025 [Acidimicrobiia bacterium]